MSIELRVVLLFAATFSIGWIITRIRKAKVRLEDTFLDGNVGRFAGTWIISQGILLAVINTGDYFSSKFGVFYYDMFII